MGRFGLQDPSCAQFAHMATPRKEIGTVKRVMEEHLRPLSPNWTADPMEFALLVDENSSGILQSNDLSYPIYWG